MRRGTALAIESRPGWDGEPTELDLHLDFSQLEPRRPVVVRTIKREDDDLPMLDDSEFVAALGLEDLDCTRCIRPPAPSLRRQEPAPSDDRRALVIVLITCSVIILFTWAFRTEIARLVSVI